MAHSSGDMQKLPTTQRPHEQNQVKFAAEFEEFSSFAPAKAGAQEGPRGC